ncbi:MAG: hypothetical protein Q8L65_06970 [Burkholderiales bacterium]|nr:hypothetical protein [Burkholderiales bacterium]MDP2398968.1 hypothetical protein [Burkholderiales bacterium]
MGNKRYKESKAKRERGGFLAMPFNVLNSRTYAGLSAHAVKLLLDLGSQYRGDNNGDLSAAWKLMKPKGWRSEETLAKAKQELLRAGFIIEMRKGRRPNVCSLYALTWQALDPSTKHDAGPKGFTFGAWKANEPMPAIKPRVPTTGGKITPLTTPAVVAEAA